MSNLQMPYKGGLGGGFETGKSVHMRLIALNSEKGFFVNFILGNGDIAFHFNPRSHQQCIVRNSKQGGQWDFAKEEREGGFPLEVDKEFELVITCEADAFKVSVNGASFCAFAHRFPPSDIREMHIEGDAQLLAISYG